MFQFLARLFRRPPRAGPKPDPRRTRLGVESLEDRRTPAALLSGGVLMLDGTSGHDSVSVYARTSEGVSVLDVVINGATQTFTASSVTPGRVEFRGADGDDFFLNAAALYSLGHDGAADPTAGDAPRGLPPGGDSTDGGAGRDTTDSTPGPFAW